LLSDQGIDVHLALPDYRELFRRTIAILSQNKLLWTPRHFFGPNVHLARDRRFFHQTRIYDASPAVNLENALVFQREVLHFIIPIVQPNLIICCDWMSGLIPAAVKISRIPCLFIAHNLNNGWPELSQIEDRGIDAAAFWNQVYYRHLPGDYEDSRRNPVDLLTSGIFAADCAATTNSLVWEDLMRNESRYVSPAFKTEWFGKFRGGKAFGLMFTQSSSTARNKKLAPHASRAARRNTWAPGNDPSPWGRMLALSSVAHMPPAQNWVKWMTTGIEPKQEKSAIV
jgi:hypothetical protein